MLNETKVIQYQPIGTCSKFMQVVIDDNKIVDAEIIGGCNGNLQGIKNLIIGMNIDDVISRLEGIKCGPKDTSCPDQLAKCLIGYKSEISSTIL